MDSILFYIAIIFIIWFFLQKVSENFTDEKLKDIQIVVARFNEDLDWINTDPFNKYPIICYNKGINSNFKIKSKHQTVRLKNVGRCDHTYLYHIVNNYDNLAKYTLFLPGSNELNYKLFKSKYIINQIEKYDKCVFVGTEYKNVKNDLYNFTLNKHKCAHSKNNLLHQETGVEKSKIRPFGKWYEHHFGNREINFVSYWGVFAVSRKQIQQHPKEYYENFIKELETSSNPEVGHYIERSWCAIFYPLNDTIFVTKYNTLI
jgi:hypothetical protein